MNFTPKTPEEEIVRAGEAKRIIESAMWQEAIRHIDGSLAAQRQAVPLRETEMHTRLIIAEQVFVKLQEFFQQIVDTGQMAEITLANKRSALQRMADNFRR
jgi:hypothetical protein